MLAHNVTNFSPVKLNEFSANKFLKYLQKKKIFQPYIFSRLLHKIF